MKTILRRIGFGVILWTIPYVSAIPMLPLATSAPIVFKSLVISIAAITSSILAIVYFKSIEKGFLRESVVLSITWVITNWILDVLGLLPFTHQTLPQYFMEIGIEYIAMSAPIIAIGYLLSQKVEKQF